MLDSKYLRHHPEQLAQQLATRGYVLEVETLKQLAENRKKCQLTVQTLQQQANSLAKQLGQIKTVTPQITETSALSALRKTGLETKKALHQAEVERQQSEAQWQDFLLRLPNIPHASVPIGCAAADNMVIRSWGNPKVLDFAPQDHIALAGPEMDFEAAVGLAGSRFVVLRGKLARLHRALIQWMLDIHTQEHGYEEVYVPYLANKQSLQNTGQLPLFAADLFAIPSTDFYLIPTAEVPITNLARNKIFDAAALPQKYVCHTPCFRSEAGSYGKDVRGMIRQHQFEKVELVRLTTPETAEQALEALTHDAEVILQRLELPYQVVALCTGDLGFAATKTYDLEVWLPSQGVFREISSCSHMGDFQARRLKARWRNPYSQKIEYIHTLNGSGLAVGRTLIAILENYQDKQGNIQIPSVLESYMGIK
jgi:seryl-tRNA synthetase